MLIKISWNWEKYILVPKRTTNNQENKKLTIYTPKKKKKSFMWGLCLIMLWKVELMEINKFNFMYLCY